MIPERKLWSQDRNEAAVEKFYEAGIGEDHDWHGGYRNFGWWEGEHQDYMRAAETLVLRLNDLLSLNAESYLLDVACGSAPQDVLLHSRTGARIECLDATWPQVKRGAERIRDAKMADKVRIHHGTATDLSAFEPDTFTHVLCIEGAQHFDTREDFFRQAFSRLKPKGVLALADFIALVEPKRAWERMVVRRAQRLWYVPDANVLDHEGYRKTLENAGFQNITFEDVGKHILPGYYRDQSSAETARAHRRFKGRKWRLKQCFANYFVFKAWQMRLMEYSLVRAVKP
jgi:ubiquinone/menaquinone biosynthesis C-methylase UbiE